MILWVGGPPDLVAIGVGSEDMMFLAVEGQGSTRPCLHPSLMFISKAHGMHSHLHEILGRRHNN